MGSFGCVRIAQLSSIAVPQKLHCEIVKLDVCDSLKKSIIQPNSVEQRLSGRKSSEHHQSALHQKDIVLDKSKAVKFKQDKESITEGSIKGGRLGRRGEGKKKKRENKEQNSVNEEEEKEDDNSGGVGVSGAGDCSSSSVGRGGGGVSGEKEEEEVKHANKTAKKFSTYASTIPKIGRESHCSLSERRRQLLSIFSKVNKVFSLKTEQRKEKEETSEELNGEVNTVKAITLEEKNRRRITTPTTTTITPTTTTTITNNDNKNVLKKQCSIDVRNVSVQRVHFNCQPVLVVSLDGNNNVQEVKESSEKAHSSSNFPLFPIPSSSSSSHLPFPLPPSSPSSSSSSSSSSSLSSSSSSPTHLPPSTTQQSATTFGQAIGSLWSNNSNKFRLFILRQSKDKGRFGKDLSKGKEKIIIQNSTQGGDSVADSCGYNDHEEKNWRNSSDNDNDTVCGSLSKKSKKNKNKKIKKGRVRNNIMMMNSYVEKLSSVGLTKPSQLQQSLSTKESNKSQSQSLFTKQFGFSQSTGGFEHERVSNIENDNKISSTTTTTGTGTITTKKDIPQSKLTSRLPTFLSKLAHPTAKIKSTGIPAPKLLSSKSIGNVSIDIHNSDNLPLGLSHGHRNEHRRASFVSSTNSCDNISNVSASAVSSSSSTTNGRIQSGRNKTFTGNCSSISLAKKAQSSHNVSSGVCTKQSKNSNDTIRIATKSVSNLSTNTSASSGSNTKTTIPRLSCASLLTGSRSSKMDQIGGRITETTTDRSTVGIPIHVTGDKYGPVRKSGASSALQASAARFHQHQSQIYSQRMNFFGVQQQQQQQQQPQPQQQQSHQQQQQQQKSFPISSLSTSHHRGSSVNHINSGESNLMPVSDERRQQARPLLGAQTKQQPITSATIHNQQHTLQNGAFPK